MISVDSEWTSKKSCQSVCVLPTFEDVPSFTKHTHLSFKDISISAFREVLEDVYQQQTARISREGENWLGINLQSTSCQSVSVLPTFKDVPSFTKHTHLSFKDISVSAFREVVEDVCYQQTDRIFQEGSVDSRETKPIFLLHEPLFKDPHCSYPLKTEEGIFDFFSCENRVVPFRELKQINVACQKLIEERESGQQDLSEAVKLLKSCQSVCVLPTFEDVPRFTQPSDLSFKDISISTFRELLEDVCQEQTAIISQEELKEIKEACQKLIEERERGQQDLSEAVKLLKSSAQKGVENTEKVFAELIRSLEKKRSEIKEHIRAREKTEIDRAEKLNKRLDQELTQLRKRQMEIEKLLITNDQVNFLKSCQSVCILPTFEDVPSLTQHTHLSFKDISISAFRKVVEDVCQQQTAKISREGAGDDSLQLHYQSPAFMKHKLVEASRNIQENICLNHGKPLDIYCQDDHQCICCLCIIDKQRPQCDITGI
ncbi:hypothetical protein QQF64_009035 [Cirrhinus molitorella]|uniref:TRIM8/14/16/25/29/45/65 coiled-coil region domain-containing protein n=1 Tax=Cirrhinus molitorella TaxID=172907 RepID=A0ABR3M7V6_9TELE